MHDRHPIREARSGGSPIRAIARDLGVDRGTVRRAIAPGARSKYWRRSAVEDATEAVRDILADYSGMTVSNIAVLIDWRHSRRALSNLVAQLRPEYSRASPIEARSVCDLEHGRLTAGTITVGTIVVGTVTLGR